MKLGTWAWVGGVSCGALVAMLGAPALIAACSSSPPPAPATGSGDGGACANAPGAFPAPNCDPTGESCPAVTAQCTATPCDTSPCTAYSSSAPCLAMADNTGQSTVDLRLRKLNITAPAALSKQFIQENVIDLGINLPYVCGEGGQGSFNWLIQFDTNSGLLTTGGGPPTADPFGVGYCFLQAGINGMTVKPVQVQMTKNSDGSWNSATIPKLYVPIYSSGALDAGLSTAIILPLTNPQIKNVTLSDSGNCIGAYNPNGVCSPVTGANGTSCADKNDTDCQRWHTAGSLGGYITLKESEGVYVTTLSKTLCVLLTQGVSVTSDGAHCQTDANGNVIGVTGDYCSTTNAPGGCPGAPTDAGPGGDSYWLSATFAASAVKINDGSADPQCNGSDLTGGSTQDGGATSDGGTSGEAGTPSDASAD